MQYRFTCRYKSEFGAWSEGDIAEFDAQTAAWLLRDVEGCIEPLADVLEREAAEAEEAERKAEEDRLAAEEAERLKQEEESLAAEAERLAAEEAEKERALETPQHDRQMKKAPRTRGDR